MHAYLQASPLTGTGLAGGLGWAEGGLVSVRLAGIAEVQGVMRAVLVSGTQLPEHLLNTVQGDDCVTDRTATAPALRARWCPL